jgi:hypothetical protein
MQHWRGEAGGEQQQGHPHFLFFSLAHTPEPMFRHQKPMVEQGRKKALLLNRTGHAEFSIVLERRRARNA